MCDDSLIRMLGLMGLCTEDAMKSGFMLPDTSSAMFAAIVSSYGLSIAESDSRDIEPLVMVFNKLSE